MIIFSATSKNKRLIVNNIEQEDKRYKMKNFSLIGAAGYVAPRHMKAIKDTGNNLVSAVDLSDSVGVLDSYFPNAEFFTRFEDFVAYTDMERRVDRPLEFVSIVSPNYLHNSHIRFALRSGADAICEKPIVLNPGELDELKDCEENTGGKINTILQLRLHQEIINLKNDVLKNSKDKKLDIDLTYVASRGLWYHKSWKGSQSKSGGVTANIGIHFFDMLGFVFGGLCENISHLNTFTKSAGYLEFERARVRWFLSVDIDDLPEVERLKGKRVHRSMSTNGKIFNFSEGFNDLHTQSYEEIIAGRGFGLEDSRSSLEIVYELRNAAIAKPSDFTHPFVSRR